jgi:hypothetical protein
MPPDLSLRRAGVAHVAEATPGAELGSNFFDRPAT